ncbi:MAG: hypothetical protein IJD04_03460, partial [Desulfovibrionaceae bacterium]|nr:hypothetical protein [Desulfovibrionaceae bacterium]
MRYSSLIPAVIGVSLLILPACSGTSSQVSRLEERIAALENEQYNFQAKQESLNAWEAGRLSAVESKHPDISIPPPPKYLLRETAPAAARNTPAQGEVVETSPGQARIAPAAVQPSPAAQTAQTSSNPDAAVKVYPS